MKNSNFPHHTGGVVQVRHTTRYGAVPEALLEDSRLDLDSRAVAAWLAVKQDGWQILVGVLRARLGRDGQQLLGKDRWQRIANELEHAGYLTRNKVHGSDGRWTWHVTFTPSPEIVTRAGFAGSGSASHAFAGSGLSVRGKPGHKEVPSSVTTGIKTTTTDGNQASISTRQRKKAPAACKAGSVQIEELHYPQGSARELSVLKRLIESCPAESRQDVLDEVEANRRAGAITRGIVPLTEALVNKVKDGEFALSAGHGIQESRDKSASHHRAYAASVNFIGALMPMSEADIAKLPPNIAKRLREKAAPAKDEGPPRTTTRNQ